MSQGRFGIRLLSLVLISSTGILHGRPFQSKNDGDVVYTSTKTTVVTTARVTKSPEKIDTIRPDNVVGVVFGSAAIFIANAMLLLLYLRKRRRKAGQATQKSDKKEKRGSRAFKIIKDSSKSQETADKSEAVPKHRASILARIFSNPEPNPEDSKQSGEPDNSNTDTPEKTKTSRESKGKSKMVVNTEISEAGGGVKESKAGFLGKLLQNSGRDHTSKEGHENNPQASSEVHVTFPGTTKADGSGTAAKAERRSLFGIFNTKITNPARKAEGSENAEEAVKDGMVDSPSRHKIGVFKELRKRTSIHVVTDLKSEVTSEKKDSALDKLTSKVLSPVKRESSKLKNRSSTGIKSEKELDTNTDPEKRESGLKKKSRMIFSPDKRKASKDTKIAPDTDGITSLKETAHSPNKFQSVLQKFQQAVEVKKDREKPQSAGDKKKEIEEEEASKT